ncbi:MAG: hypothetical protein IT428_16595 [Planctomycetaceae bacterium]|nr:hypothetical protein [Planctomycetaceae bacterium]
MIRHLATLALCLTAFPAAAQAQFGVPMPGGISGRTPSTLNRPTVSPYINLLRSGDPTLNYYGNVRPQVRFQTMDDDLQRGLNRLDNEQFRQPTRSNRPQQPLQFGSTGHSSKFFSDFQGRPESLVLEMRARKLEQFEQVDRTGSYRPETGHSVHFGNSGFYYRQK